MQVENGQLLCLGLLSKIHKVRQGWLLLFWGLWTLETFWESPQCKPRQVTCVEEPLEESWARQVFGGPGRTVLIRLMESIDMAPASASAPEKSCPDNCPSSPCPEDSPFS